MPNVRAQFRAFADLARVSNLPTIVTNVLVGVVAGVGAGDFPWSGFLFASAAIALLYVSGMIFNDVADAAFDQAHRSDRPIPSGRIPRTTAAILGAATMILGLVPLLARNATAAVWSVLLAVAILAYDFLHKRLPAAVILMGICRGLVYLIAAAVVKEPIPWAVVAPFSISMTLYIIAVTIVARREHLRGGSWPVIAELLLVAVILAPALFVRPDELLWAIVAGVIATLWIVRGGLFLRRGEPATGQAVQAWLAGICLIDGFFLALLDAAPAAIGAATGLFVVTFLSQRRVSGT